MAKSITVRAIVIFSFIVGPLGARARAPACKLQVSLDPPVLSAGVEKALVRVVTDGALPRLVASSGDIRNLRPDGPTDYVADFYPANAEEPQAAIIAVGLESDACGFVTARVEGRSARRAGPVLLLLRPPAAPADQEADVSVRVFAADESGRSWGGAAPALAVSNGRLTNLESAGAGAWLARWHVTPQEGRTSSVAASLAEGSTFTAALERSAGPVAALRVEFDRPSAAPGDPKPVTVTVHTVDAAGNPSDGDLAVESDLGGLGDLVRVEQGVYRVPLQVASALRGDRAITVEARVGALSEQAVLALVAGAPETISIVAPDSVPADGKAVRQITVEVVDAFGNPVEDERVETESKLSELGQPVRVAPGRWIFSYRTQWSQQDRVDVLTIRAGSLAATRSIALVSPSPPFSFAPKVGVVYSDSSFALAVSADAAAWTRLGPEQVGLSAEASWWSFTKSGQTSTTGASFSYTSTSNYVPLVLSLAWRRPIASRFMVWVRLGGGVSWVESTLTSNGQPAVAASSWVPTAAASAAFGLRVWNGFPFAEVRAGWVGNPNLANLNGALVPVFLLLGYRFDAG